MYCQTGAVTPRLDFCTKKIGIVPLSKSRASVLLSNFVAFSDFVPPDADLRGDPKALELC